LTIQNTATISGGSATSYIQTTNTGTLIQEVSTSNVVFSVGNQSYTPVTLNNSGTTDNFNVRVDNVVYLDGTSGNVIATDVVDVTWYINEETANGSDITATFQWNTSDEMTNFDKTQAFVSNYHTNKWNNGTASAALGNNPYTLTESEITSFSPFIVASDANVLPVELLYFYAEKEGKNVRLDWQTATELNNSHFDVEWSTSGIYFENIGEVAGAGKTNEIQFYDFLHVSPALDLNYYRLKQVDFDGQFEYSKIIQLTTNKTQQVIVKVFPNPVSDILNIETTRPTIIQIINATGQVLKEQQISPTSKISVEDLPAGIYFLKAGNQVQKIIKR
jgi:hypothetical protein